MPFIVPNQTSYIKERPITTASGWTRPGDWITITDATGEVQFLVSDLAYPSYRINTTFTRTGGVGNIYIDWGDGVIDTITTLTATDTSHLYTSGGTPCSLGYNTWKIRIYGDAGTRITSAYQLSSPSKYFNIPNNPLSGTLIRNMTGLLEAYYGLNTITSAQFLFSYSVQRPLFYHLQYVKLPSVMTGSGNLLENAFGTCIGLRKVDMPLSFSGNTSLRDTFASCFLLQEITIASDMTNILDMTNAFQACQSLTSITLPTLNNTTDLSGAFNGCYSLPDIDFLPPLPSCQFFNTTFQNCRSLITANIKSFRQVAGSISFNNTFNGCVSLEYVNLPPILAGSSITISGAFRSCYNLKSFIAPTNFNTISLNTTFRDCWSLASCVLPSSVSLISDMTDCFANCYNLQEITLPTSSTNYSIQGAFSNCYNLSSIIIPNNIAGTFLNTFTSCNSLVSVSIPSGITSSSISSLASAFNGCVNLQSLTLPNLPNATTNISGLLSNCYSISNFTLGTANGITTIASMLSGCLTLDSVSFPSSMPALTTANNIFASSGSISKIVYPTTTGLITTWASAHSGAFSLQSVVLPTTQSTTLTSAAAMFLNTYALTGITNLDKLGNPSTAVGNTSYVDGTNMFVGAYLLPTIDLYCKFSKFEAQGTTTIKTALTSLRLRNNGAGQYGGTSPQINISYTDLGQAALVQVFNDLPTITAKTINITGATGAAALTAGERAIATGKGWTIVG